MEKEYLNLLNKLVKEYSNFDYQDGFYGKMLSYHLDKEKLIVSIGPSFSLDGEMHEHSELIKEIVIKLNKIFPKDFVYRLTINGWYCDIKNGDFDLNFQDGRYHIKPEHQEMHDKKEVATIEEVLNLNKGIDLDIKWNLLKKKSIELGFVPVKEKNGFENLYLIEAFKQCYPNLNYNFEYNDENQNQVIIEPKRKKFLGLF
jgi:hypothetical protein